MFYFQVIKFLTDQGLYFIKPQNNNLQAKLLIARLRSRSIYTIYLDILFIAKKKLKGKPVIFDFTWKHTIPLSYLLDRG